MEHTSSSEKGKNHGPQQGSSKAHKDEESLSTVLDEEQRGELVFLIASIMSNMRKTVSSGFDANVSLIYRPLIEAKDWQVGKSEDIKRPSKPQDEKLEHETNDPATVDVAKADQDRKLKEQREKELSAPSMKELKLASLKFFDDWRSKVIGRVGEAINAKREAKHQSQLADQDAAKTKTPQDIGDENKDDSLQSLFPPLDTALTKLPREQRILIVHSTLLLLISLEHYFAPSRVLLLRLVSSLGLPLKVLTDDEEKVAKGLLEAAKELSGDSETKKKVDENKDLRKWKVGLASVAGAALIGVTGGLAAPLVAAGVGSVMGGLGLGATAAAGYLGTVAGSSVIVGGLFGAYGGRMTGQMMDNYSREVEDFAFLPITKSDKINWVEKSKLKTELATEADKDQGNVAEKVPNEEHASTKESQKAAHSDEEHEAYKGIQDPEGRRLRVTIGITGWLTSKDQIVTPWHVIGENSEVFGLRWELEALMKLGHSIDAMVSSAAWGYAKSEIIQRTIFAQLASATMWPVALIQVGRVVDNPFSIAKVRADKAGEVLADALINRAQGERPVTLLGYSLGARVIFACLKSLAHRRAFGLVESAILIGAPTPAATADWRILRSVVSGRLVNVHSTNDYILGFLYRTSSVQYGVAGLEKIEGIPSVENVDVSETVSGHLRYRYLIGAILKRIGYEDLDMSSVEREAAAYEKMVADEEKRTYTDSAKESSQKVLQDNPLGIGATTEEGAETQTKTTGDDSEKQRQEAEAAANTEATKMEQQVNEKTQQGMLQSVWESLSLRQKKQDATPASGSPGQGSGQKDSSKPSPGKGDTAKKDGAGWTSTLTGGYLH